jgi:hypothetical protein
VSLGTLKRDPADDFPVSVSFADVDVFTSSAVTTATATVTAATDADGEGQDTSGLTLGSATVAANVVTFRVSGGTAGVDYTVTVKATNTDGDDVERSIRVATMDL